MKVKALFLMIGCCVVTFFVSGCHPKPETSAVAPPTDSSETIIQKADVLYTQREDISKLRLGVSLLNQGRAADDTNYEILWRISKFDYYLATHPSNDDERDRAFREGIDAGRAAVQEQNGRVEGHFWLGANYGGSAKTGMLAGLSTVSDIREQMQAVIKIDPSYEGASAYMVLGQLELDAPKVLGGDQVQAIKDLEQGNKISPQNLMLKLTLARAYKQNKRFADAKKQLDEIEKMAPDKDHIPEDKEVLAQAEEMRKELK